MTNTPENYGTREENFEVDDAVGAQQVRTRGKFFHSVGAAGEFGLDAAEFALKGTLYTAGRTVRGGVDGARALYRGIMRRPYEDSSTHGQAA